LPEPSAIAGGADDRIGIFRPAGSIVRGRQSDRDRLLSAGGEFGDEPVPFPRVASSAGTQDIGRQGHLHQRSSEDRKFNAWSERARYGPCR
jgi:hypothetical protein